MPEIVVVIEFPSVVTGKAKLDSLYLVKILSIAAYSALPIYIACSIVGVGLTWNVKFALVEVSSNCQKATKSYKVMAPMTT